MKSSKEQLEKRGYLNKGEERLYTNLHINEKLNLLQSILPKDRTLGARLLSNEKEPVSRYLIRALKEENKLYSKIEICKTLEIHFHDSISLLIDELGCIGSNQYQKVPIKEFGKDNYPLPRDIAARTLANIGIIALPQLLRGLQTDNLKQLSELIDAIGYICYNDNSTNVFMLLKDCYLQHNQNDLISWKLVRAMSGFKDSLEFLKDEIVSCKHDRIKKEIHRSIRLLEKSCM